MFKELRQEEKRTAIVIAQYQRRQVLKRYYAKYKNNKLVQILTHAEFLTEKDTLANYFMAYDEAEYKEYKQNAHRGRPIKRY